MNDGDGLRERRERWRGSREREEGSTEAERIRIVYLSVVLARTASTATLAPITPRSRMAGVMQPPFSRSVSIAALVVHTRASAAVCDCASMSSNCTSAATVAESICMRSAASGISSAGFTGGGRRR